MNSLVKMAGDSLKAGRFAQALALYERAAASLGEANFRWNLDYCRRQLDAQRRSPVQREASVDTFRRSFDQVFVVNMREAVARRLATAIQLHALGIEWRRVEAVDGRVGEVRAQYERYAATPLGSLKRYPDFAERERRRGSHFIGSPGAMGYLHTYIGLIRRARDEGLRRILILEDDVLLSPDFFERFAAFSDAIRPDWKILQLGASQYNWHSVDEAAALRAGCYLPRQIDTCGSFAIGLDSSIYDELLDALEAFESPFDHLAIGELYERHLGACFVAYPNIVVPDVATSDIREGRDQVAHAAKMRWRMDDFEYPRRRPSVAVLVSHPRNLKYLSGFARPEVAPFELRLVVATDDGLRPLHTAELLEKPFNACQAVSEPLTMPACDLAVSIDPQAALTEADLVAALEARLRGGTMPASLTPLAIETPVVDERLVSVIIPTYKRPQNLASALESVASQDYPFKEILVVSDNPAGSEFIPATREIVEACRARHPDVPIQLIEHVHNRNGAAARNSGWQRSRGAYLCFLDDDDIFLPGRLSRSVAALGASPSSIGAVYCGFVGGNSAKDDPARYKPGNLTRELLMLDYRKHYLCTNTATYRRSAVLALNGFDETYRRHQDIEFNLRFFQRYEMGVVLGEGVRLRPAPTDVNNMVFNADIIALKEKFLGQFAYLIEREDEATRQAIYDKHWTEVARYTTDTGSILGRLTEMDANGPLQVYIRLNNARKKENQS